MKYNQFSPDLAGKPIRLLQQEVENPFLVLREIFEFYDLNNIRVQLYNWLELAYASEDEDMKYAISRVNLMQFVFQMEALAEAAFILYETQRRMGADQPAPAP